MKLAYNANQKSVICQAGKLGIEREHAHGQQVDIFARKRVDYADV